MVELLADTWRIWKRLGKIALRLAATGARAGRHIAFLFNRESLPRDRNIPLRDGGGLAFGE